MDKIERSLFVFGVLAFAFLMLVFGEPVAGSLKLPVVGLWLVVGLGFVWWFDRHLAAANRNEGKVARLDERRRRRLRH